MCPLKEADPSLLAFDQTTFGELDRLADEMARTLESCRIGPGDRIAFHYRPCPEVAALFFATWRIGASICPLSLRLPFSQIEPHLSRLQARAYIDSFPIAPHMREATDLLPFPAALLFTSGSTSQPKIAVLSLDNLIANAKPAVSWLDLRKGDAWLLNLPLYHVGGLSLLLRCVLAEARVVLDERDPGVTHISAVPTQLYRASPVYKNLRTLLIGGAPIPTYPQKLPCYLSYGLTEMGSLVAARFKPSGPPFDLSPLPGREVRLSQIGEIELRGSCLFQGYWENGRIARSFDQWFATGDIGRLSEKRLAILGRKDWQFISGGENIQPEEIESALLTIPGVWEAAVVPIEDPEFGQRPAAVLKSGINDAGMLKATLLERLPKFKVPIRFFFVDELPKTGLKINRKEISEFANKNI